LTLFLGLNDKFTFKSSIPPTSSLSSFLFLSLLLIKSIKVLDEK